MGWTAGKWLHASLIIASLIIAGVISAGTASADTLDRITQNKSIRLAYREDAPPFSYTKADGDRAGYMLDLCRAVVVELAAQLHVPSLDIVYVPVTAASRFEAITAGKADLLCEATSATLSRREVVDFSIPTFIDGAGLMVRGDEPGDLSALGGKKVGVLAGTTTETVVRDFLKKAGVTATLVPVKTHAEGLTMLDDGTVSAYFGDRSILLFLAQNSKGPDKLRLADQYLTIEPYGLALFHGDERFRLAVDRALSHIYRSDAIEKIFANTFGGKVNPRQILQSLYVISGLPD
jgi:ABC-type amino acid transport substrate-binding protein